MRRCTKCNAEIADRKNFCEQCGTPAPKPSIAEVNEQIARERIKVEEERQKDESLRSAEAQREQEANRQRQEALQREENSKREDARKRQYLELVEKRSKVEAEASRVNKRIEEEISRQDQLRSWQSKNTSSFLWRTFDTMTQNIDLARRTLSDYQKAIDSLNIPQVGEMHKLRKRFHRRLLISFIVIPAIMYLLLSMPRILASNFVFDRPLLYRILNNFYFDPKFIYAVGLPLLLIIVILSLISYYRGWSRYQAKVNKLLWEMENIAQNAALVRAEELRLAAIYPQVREWLEIIGHSLNTPWRINPSWLEGKIDTIEKESLPFSLHIAQVSVDDESAMLAMQRQASEKFMTRGWRTKVFADQIDVIREQMALPRERLNIDQLDADIAFAPNGPRAVVASLIAKDEVLERVARRQLVPLALQVQRETMDGVRPAVSEVRTGQVNALQREGEDGEVGRIAWDDFLKMPLGDERRMVTPLSINSLSDAGQVAGHQGRVDSFVIVPRRLENAVHHVKESNIRTYDEKLNLPMEIVVRLDFSGPIADEDVRMLAPAPQSVKPKRDRTQESGI